jgi:hypothetical protein
MNVTEAAVKILYQAEELAEAAEKKRREEFGEDRKEYTELLAFIEASIGKDGSIYERYAGAPEDHAHAKARKLINARSEAKRAKAYADDLRAIEVLEKQLDAVCEIIGNETE